MILCSDIAKIKMLWVCCWNGLFVQIPKPIPTMVGGGAAFPGTVQDIQHFALSDLHSRWWPNELNGDHFLTSKQPGLIWIFQSGYMLKLIKQDGDGSDLVNQRGSIVLWGQVWPGGRHWSGLLPKFGHKSDSFEEIRWKCNCSPHSILIWGHSFRPYHVNNTNWW